MEKIFLKPLAIGILAISFSCSSSNEGTTTAGNEGAMERGDTEIAGTSGTDMEPLETEQASNTDIDFEGMFENVDTENYDILELARTNEDLSTFVDLMEKSGLDVSLQSTDQELTVFIPTNEAFENLTKERYEYLTDPQNRTELVSVIQAHIIPMDISSAQFSDNQRIETADGKYIEISTQAQGTNVNIGGASIVKSDVEASNGTIHVVDAVIEPTEDPSGIGTGTY